MTAAVRTSLVSFRGTKQTHDIRNDDQLHFSLGVNTNDMPPAALPTVQQWGHPVSSISPVELVTEFARLAAAAITSFDALPDGPEPCNNKADYHRVSIVVPLPKLFFDQLMNGPNGYRAHYAAGVDVGERFNLQLVANIASLFIESEHLYADRFSRTLCSNSLLGPFTKLWYSKQLTDPAANNFLLALPEAIQLWRWKRYWRFQDKPRKGLLAPVPEDTSVLVNGSFVNGVGDVFEQKPARSRQLFESGWT